MEICRRDDYGGEDIRLLEEEEEKEKTEKEKSSENRDRRIGKERHEKNQGTLQ